MLSHIALTLLATVTGCEWRQVIGDATPAGGVRGTGGAAPLPRWGAVAAESNYGSIFLYGGECEDHVAGDAWCLNFDLSTTRAEWTPLPELAFVARKWHSAVPVYESAPSLLCFGGENDDAEAARTAEPMESSAAPAGGDAVIEAEDPFGLHVFDFELSIRYAPGAGGKPPSRRSGHSLNVFVDTAPPTAALSNGDALRRPQGGRKPASAAPHFAVVFGGIRGRQWLNDVHVLFMGTYRWLPAKPQGRPPAPRCYHCTATLGSRLIVFGGNNSERSFNDVHVLDCSAGAHRSDAWEWSTPECVGAPPRPRTGATATAIGDRWVLIAGGWDPDNTGGRRAKRARGSPGASGQTPTTASASSGRGGAHKSSPAEPAAVTTPGATAAASPATAGSSGASKRRRRATTGDDGAQGSSSSPHGTSPAAAATAASASVVAADAGIGHWAADEDDEGDGAGDAVRPFADAYLLDTLNWEWLRLRPRVVTASAAEGHASPFHAGRVGASAVLLAETVARPSYGGSGIDPSVLFVGGVKSDGHRHADVALLTLPAELLGGAGRSGDATDDIPDGQPDVTSTT